MSSNALTHVILTDDDGSGTTGTILNNSVFADVQNAVDAAIGQTVQTKSGNYTVLVTDDSVICTAVLTLTLYAAAGNTGRQLEVPNQSTGDVTIDGNASETINGSLTLTVPAGATAYLRTNGSNWLAAIVYPSNSDQVLLAAQIFG